MKYSFVLPAYKAIFLKDAIESILSQTFQDFELIIVNDASPQDLDSIVSKFNDDRVQYYVNKKNIGGRNLVEQWNNCLQYASGEYVILASDDDVYSPVFLEKMDELILTYPEVNVFRPRIHYINSDGVISGYGYTEGYLKEKVSKLEFIQAWINGWVGSGIPFYVIKKKSLQNIGYFVNYPCGWFSDDATVIKLLDQGMAYSSDVLFYFRMSGFNITTKLQSKQICLKKLEATEHFVNFLNNELNNAKITTNEDEFILSDIKSKLRSFIYEGRVLPVIFNAPFNVVLSIFPNVVNLKFIPKAKLIERYIKYILRKLFF